MKRTILNFTDFSLHESADMESHADISNSYMEELRDGVRKLLEKRTPIEIWGLEYDFDYDEHVGAFIFFMSEFKRDMTFSMEFYATPFYGREHGIPINIHVHTPESYFEAYEGFIPITIEFKGNEFSKNSVKNADIANLYGFFISKLRSLNVLKPGATDLWKSPLLVDEFNSLYSDDDIVTMFSPKAAIFIATHILDPERGEPLIRKIKLAARSKKMFGV